MTIINKTGVKEFFNRRNYRVSEECYNILEDIIEKILEESSSIANHTNRKTVQTNDIIRGTKIIGDLIKEEIFLKEISNSEEIELRNKGIIYIEITIQWDYNVIHDSRMSDSIAKDWRHSKYKVEFTNNKWKIKVFDMYEDNFRELESNTINDLVKSIYKFYDNIVVNKIVIEVIK